MNEYSFSVPSGAILGIEVSIYEKSGRCFVEAVSPLIEGKVNPLDGRVHEGDELVYLDGKPMWKVETRNLLGTLLGPNALIGTTGHVRLTFNGT
tara:strand:+ start:667 stop:948 length:282 start_codon:yes stop_codon:yes gene_type:complete